MVRRTPSRTARLLVLSLAPSLATLLAGYFVPALAQKAVGAALSPSERREQLAKLTEGLNSPDPLERAAMLEATLQGEDLLARTIALQSALGSSDAIMRNYAATLILGRTQVMNIELSVPPDVQAQLDKAGDDAAKSKVYQAYTWLFRVLGTSSYQVSFAISNFDAATGRLKVACQGEPHPSGQAADWSVGQLIGSSLEFHAVCNFPGTYRNECSASLQLASGGVFAGKLSCNDLLVPVPATLRLH